MNTKVGLALLALFGLVPALVFAAAPQAQQHAHSAPVCPGAASATDARCHAHVVTDANGIPVVASARGQENGKGGSGKGGGGGGGGGSIPPGYGPAQFQTAYGIAGLSSNKTVAIVDAYDNPYAEKDLATYSNTFGLPACTTANGCFKKVNQTGGTRYPRADLNWALEIALDVQMVHAACPSCHILLVEAASNNFSDLLAADSYAAAHADVVSNSWGAPEFSGEQSYDGYFMTGKPMVVSTGDNGYGVQWPAASPYAVSVGGTKLSLNADNTRASEVAWTGAGSGCSAYEQKPSWQNDACTNRTVADVSADADPNTGAAVYDSYGFSGQNGWFVVGGTSLAAPLVASLYALGGGTSAATLYASPASLFDVTSGSNGSCGSYLCNAMTGYDGPTGLGAPVGIAAF